MQEPTQAPSRKLGQRIALTCASTGVAMAMFLSAIITVTPSVAAEDIGPCTGSVDVDFCLSIEDVPSGTLVDSQQITGDTYTSVKLEEWTINNPGGGTIQILCGRVNVGGNIVHPCEAVGLENPELGFTYVRDVVFAPNRVPSETGSDPDCGIAVHDATLTAKAFVGINDFPVKVPRPDSGVPNTCGP